MEWGRAKLQEVAIPIVLADDQITLRGLHYALVSRGMPNTLHDYKRLGSAMTDARWKGLLSFKAFTDNDRMVLGGCDMYRENVEEQVAFAMQLIQNKLNPNWLRHGRWADQPEYVEVWIEKNALRSTFADVCNKKNVVVFPCKGYPSLTWLDKAKDRFDEAEHEEKDCTIIYFGDYDPSGEDIPRSLGDNLERMGSDITVERVALLHDQVIEWELPPAPTKRGDTRSVNWDGIGQVELDAVKAFKPGKLEELCSAAISDHFDRDIRRNVIKDQKEDRKEYISKLKPELIDLLHEMEGDE